MKSTPGSATPPPLHGQVKLVPSIRNKFSLVPEPNAETLAGEAAALIDWSEPLDGDVGDTPGAALMKSIMLKRRVGIARKSSAVKRVANPLLRASIRDPGPSTTTDSATPATFNTTVRSSVAPTPIVTSAS
jgi:hypothetical protein